MDKIGKRVLSALICIGMIFPAAGCSAQEGSTAVPGEFMTAFYANTFSSPSELTSGVMLDVTTAADGYAGLSVTSEKGIKALLSLGDVQYTFSVPSDGTTAYLPFAWGEGTYHLRVMQNTVDNKYIELAAADIPVALRDEFQPFLHSSTLVKFDETSHCVAQAARLAAQAGDDTSYMALVYDYICDLMTYDNDFAASVTTGYVPDPDTTIEKGKGICVDYAALAAAMLRSQGVPTKVITGYVGKEALYHAWNAVYLQDAGWITVEIKVSAADWTRFDLTYGDAGSKQSIYVDSYVY